MTTKASLHIWELGALLASGIGESTWRSLVERIGHRLDRFFTVHGQRGYFLAAVCPEEVDATGLVTASLTMKMEGEGVLVMRGTGPTPRSAVGSLATQIVHFLDSKAVRESSTPNEAAALLLLEEALAVGQLLGRTTGPLAPAGVLSRAWELACAWREFGHHTACAMRASRDDAGPVRRRLRIWLDAKRNGDGVTISLENEFAVSVVHRRGEGAHTVALRALALSLVPVLRNNHWHAHVDRAHVRSAAEGLAHHIGATLDWTDAYLPRGEFP